MVSETFEPKSGFRWIVQLEGFDSFLLRSCQRPSVDVSQFPYIWAPLIIEMYDAIQPSTSLRVMDWIKQSDSRKLKISLLDKDGVTIEEWKMDAVKLINTDFGCLDYASNDPCTIKMTVAFSDCEFKANE